MVELFGERVELDLLFFENIKDGK